MNRDQALALVEQFTPSLSLRRHMLNVEAAMRAYALHWADRGDAVDVEQFGITGLLHDFDYEAHPDAHPAWGVAYLRENTDVPDVVLEAIMGHSARTGVPRSTLLARTLFAVDELTGLVQAAALVRPDKDVRQVSLSSLNKRFATRSFAAGVNRDEVTQAAEELGVPLEEHFQRVLKAMQEMPNLTQ